MTKLLVQTTGEFQLVDFGNDAFVLPSHRPAVTRSTSFVQANVSMGRLRVLAELPDAATDEAFEDTLANSRDTDMAVEAFKAEFAEKPVEREAPAPARKAARK